MGGSIRNRLFPSSEDRHLDISQVQCTTWSNRAALVLDEYEYSTSIISDTGTDTDTRTKHLAPPTRLVR